MMRIREILEDDEDRGILEGNRTWEGSLGTITPMTSLATIRGLVSSSAGQSDPEIPRANNENARETVNGDEELQAIDDDFRTRRRSMPSLQ